MVGCQVIGHYWLEIFFQGTSWVQANFLEYKTLLRTSKVSEPKVRDSVCLFLEIGKIIITFFYPLFSSANQPVLGNFWKFFIWLICYIIYV